MTEHWGDVEAMRNERTFPRSPDPARHGGSRGVDLSIVVPLYNEEDNVVPLHEAVTQALAQPATRYELILIDDGSRDDTFARAAALVEGDARVRVVALRRNSGQTAAMAAGIRAARGVTIVTMDGDLQNDPRDIPALVALLDQGFDLATGWRRKRQDEGKRVAISKVANRIMGAVMGVQVRDSGCSLKAYRAELIQGLPMHGEMHRFIPALSQLAGARTAQIEVRHHPRRFGQSKYGFSRIYKVMLDIVSVRFLLTFAGKPMRALAWPAGLQALPGIAILAVAVMQPAPAMVLVSIGVLLLASAGALMGWALAGLMLATTEPRLGDLARIAGGMWFVAPGRKGGETC